MRAVVNSAHGVWTITHVGRNIDSDESVRELVRRKTKDLAARAKNTTKTKPDGSPAANGNDAEGNGWEEQLLQVIRKVKPDAFERLCQGRLRAAGFLRVAVTGRSGDGGIDGCGVLRLNLLSVHVAFQRKRYSGSVGAREIRDFRGELVTLTRACSSRQEALPRVLCEKHSETERWQLISWTAIFCAIS